MFSYCKLNLYQDNKWLTIRLRSNFDIGLTTYKRFYEWLGQGQMIWGNYRIVDNYAGGSNGDFSIGAVAAPETKIWRWKPQELSLYLGTIVTYTGGGAMSMDANPEEVKDDLVLYDAMLYKKGFDSRQGVSQANGVVNIKSWIKPFEAKSLTWESAF